MCSIDQSSSSALWELASRQHGVVSARQLAAAGLSRRAIQHRLARGRLHRVMRGVYTVGRPELSRRGRWMAAVLACGPGAVLSHESAAGLWGIRPDASAAIELSRVGAHRCRRPGVIVHRRVRLERSDLGEVAGIPLTTPVRTLVDLACTLRAGELERAVNEADRLDLVDPPRLRAALGALRGQPGVGRLSALLDRRTFRLTDSELERWFLRIVADVGMPPPLTRCRVNGFRVDFHWPAIGLVVETDGLRYHRTAAQQARDLVRDQSHMEAGLTPLRFSHAQIRFEAEKVGRTLVEVAARLRSRRPGPHGQGTHLHKLAP